MSSSVGMVKAMLLRVPLILKTVLLHGIRMSPVSGKQDLRTELTVAIIRSFISFSMPIAKQQKGSMRDPGIKGPMWISKVTLPRPEDDVQEAVFQAFEELKIGGETYDIPGVVPVEAEWTGYRGGVKKNSPQPDISEEEKYNELRKESPSDTVILYFHGGAYILMDPCTHREPLAHLSKRTNSPILSVRYRLAPQNPFPAALVDALVAYLSLLAPPKGSLHGPIPANKIILAGDSAGGNLSLVLLQTLLTLRRISPTIRFHGQEIPIGLPAGLASSSPWCDITRSMPSVHHNALYDYLTPPTQDPEATYEALAFPPDNVWPCTPPRVDFYSNANASIHPLVSPLSSRAELWADAPPIFMTIGEEGLADEGILLARKMHRVGVPVVVEQFEGMPHCFGMLMIGTPAGKRFWDGFAEFCRNVGAGSRITSSGCLTYLGFKLQSSREIPLEKAVSLTDEEVDSLLQRAVRTRVAGEIQLQTEFAKAKL